MIILTKQDMQILITMAKQIFHIQKTIDILTKVGLNIEGSCDINNIGHHLYAPITNAYDEIINVLQIDKKQMTTEQIDDIDDALQEMDKTLSSKNGYLTDEYITDIYKNTFLVISKIINKSIIIR